MGTSNIPASLTMAEITVIAEAADCDPKTVLRRLAGVVVRPRLARRIDAALARHRAPSTNPPPNRAA